MRGNRSAHFLVPGRLDQRTGGYLYDARIVEGLRGLGWDVRVHELDGRFPQPDEVAARSTREALAAVPDGAFAVLDGLGFLAFRPTIDAHARRLRLVGLVHHLVSEDMGIDGRMDLQVRVVEAEVLSQCAGVIVTSPYTAERVRALGVEADRIRTVLPGTRRAAPARGPEPGASPALLCVGSVVPRKGQHVLVRALARLRDEAWTCICAGSLERDPEYAEEVRRLVRAAGLEDRVSFPGECDEEELDDLYARSSVFVLPSYYEGYGMAVAEALARGLPVVATTAGAIPLTAPPDASLLVAPGDDEGLALEILPLIGNRRSTIKEGNPFGRAGPLQIGVPEASGAPSMASAMSLAALRHAAALPDWPAAAESFAGAVLELGAEKAAADRDSPDPVTPRAGGALAQSERFSAAWLELREPVDHRSRAEALVSTLVDRWRIQGRRRVLDLGSGAGSNLRYLAPRLSGPVSAETRGQTWTLVDHDPELLARVGDSPIEGVRAYRVVGDLSTVGLRLVHATHLVTAAALLDLASEEWLGALVEACRSAGSAALFALTYDGRIEWSPAGDPDDALVREAVNAHQRRDKGTGRALGPAATSAAERLFREAGYEVQIAPSPWRLGPEHQALIVALIEGRASAAEEQRPVEARRIRDWAARRHAAVREGLANLEVGHLDLLALPQS